MERLNERQERKSKSESQLLKCNQRKQEIEAAVVKIKAIMPQHALMRHKIEENIAYRKVKARVDELDRELELLEQRRVAIGSTMVIESELLSLNQERDRLLSEVIFLSCTYLCHK